MERQPVDLVFSDVILPDGMNGVDLARAIQAAGGGTKILLTSGYTAQRLNLLGQDERSAVLRKPYNEAQLSEAISDALASPRSAGAMTPPRPSAPADQL
jgi:CheY-like chemotaxis protein